MRHTILLALALCFGCGDLPGKRKPAVDRVDESPPVSPSEDAAPDGKRPKAEEEADEILEDKSTETSVEDVPLNLTPLVLDEIGSEAKAEFLRSETLQNAVKTYESTDGSTMAWGESYILEGYVVGFEALQDEALLTKLFTRIDAVFANRADKRGQRDGVRGVVFPGWPTSAYKDAADYCWLPHSGMVTYPIARLVYNLKSNPVLAEKYAAKIDEYLAELEISVKAFDQEFDATTKSYTSSVIKPMPYNMQNAMGRTLLMLWLATGNEAYRQRVVDLAEVFKAEIQGDTVVGYVWPYQLGGPRAEDISHAAINVDFSFMVSHLGLAMSAGFVQGFAATVTRLKIGTSGFYMLVNGTGDTSYSQQMGRWGQLGFAHQHVRQTLIEYFRGKWTDGPTDFLSAAHLMRTSAPWIKPPVP